MTAMAPIPNDHPLKLAWDAYKETEDFANTKRWATVPEHTDGSLWASFMEGWNRRADTMTTAVEAIPDDVLELAEDAVRGVLPSALAGTSGRLIENFARAILADRASRSPQVAPVAEGWRNDPSADERWSAGLDYAMTQFCEVLGVDPAEVTWDAATETLDGDVRSVIGNILRAWSGEDWIDLPATRELLLAGQGDDDGMQILPDFEEGDTVLVMVDRCLHLLERHRDVIAGYSAAPGTAPSGTAEVEPVAWQHKVGGAWLNCSEYDAKTPDGAVSPNARPLYAHPPAVEVQEPDAELVRALRNLHEGASRILALKPGDTSISPYVFLAGATAVAEVLLSKHGSNDA